MAYYRCYFIDDASHVYDFAEFECDTDGEALSRASGLRAATVTEGFELWQQNRLVHRAERAPPCSDGHPTLWALPRDLPFDF